ncbi:claudin-3-like isoform X2 [Clavelina lepadiformis]|uniref:claudin-3-like isoform X2 n=1 Tax=Clavelina lepadiformis TaxID=159417 RepID=UPI00404226F1
MLTQIAAFGIGFLSTVACVVTCFWNQWAVTSAAASSSLLNSIWGFNGLWNECMQYTTGQYQCENYLTALFDQPAYLIIIRALMCISIIFSTGACFLTLVGLQCSRLLDDAPNKKRKLMFVSCCLHACAGVFTLGSMAWYTGLVVREYFSWENQDNIFRYEIGAAVYLGYVSSFFSIFAAIACGCMPGPRDETKDYAPRYTPSYKPSANGYVTKDKMEYV